MKDYKNLGFTLIELLIVLSILGILITLIYPNYAHTLYKIRRRDALIALTQAQILLEQCNAQNSSYEEPCTARPLFPKESPQHFYLINLRDLSSNTYTLTAIPQGSQSGDKDCALFSINQSNVTAAFDSSSVLKNDCWNRI